MMILKDNYKWLLMKFVPYFRVVAILRAFFHGFGGIAVIIDEEIWNLFLPRVSLPP